jgi:capsule polysaccharide export protein KpsE/RkpR
MDQRDNLLGVFRSLYRWRKAIRNVCAIALAGSIIVSLFLDNYYKATTIFYPSNPELANPETMFGYTGNIAQYFGNDRDLDRLDEIANSRELMDFLVKRFKLYEHYKIDSTDEEGPYKVRKRLLKLYSAQKNKNDAIELSLEDTDPVFAMEMANATREKVDEIAQRLVKNSQVNILVAFENNVQHKIREINELSDSLRILQARYSIYDVQAAGERLSNQLSYTQAEIVRAQARIDELEKDPLIPRDTIAYIKADKKAFESERKSLKVEDAEGENLTITRFKQGAPLIAVIADRHYQARKQLTYDMERYNQMKAAYNTKMPALQVVEMAERPLRKSRPFRSVIVIAAVLTALLFSALGAIIADTYKDVNWKAIRD